MKSILAKLSVICGAFSYGYMAIDTAFGTGEGLSFTTFLLWATLASVTCYNLVKSNGGWGITMMYAFGATTVATILIYKGSNQWSSFDTAVAILVAVCFYLSKTMGPKVGLVASVAAGVVAAVPFIIMTWENPAKSPIIPNTGFLVANTLSFLSGETWAMKDRLFGGANALACAMLVLPWLLHRFS